MTIVSCPRCNERVLMPLGASPRAAVRCPLCREQFLLAEILDSLPPALEVLEDSGAEMGLAYDQPDSSAAVALSGDEPRSVAANDAPIAFSIDRSSSTAAASSAAGAPRLRKAAARPQRKPKNPVWEIAKVALGGIAGLVIAQLLLWWMPWENWRRDPFRLGPAMAQYAPWLVPARFHGGPRGVAEPGDGSLPTRNRAETGSSGLSPSGLPQRTFDQPGTRSKGSDPTPTGPVPGAGLDPDGAMAKPVPDEMHELPSVASGEASAELSDDLVDLDSDLAEMTDLETDPGLAADLGDASVPGVRPAAASMSSAELRAALTEARTAAETWQAASIDQSRSLLAASFRAFAKLAEAASLVGEPAEEDRRAAVQLLTSLGQDADKLESLAGAGTVWLNASERRTNDGVLLVGRVTETGRQGSLYRTALALPNGAAAVIYSDSDPSATYQVDDRVLIAGAILDHPSQSLAGFQGVEQPVVWGVAASVIPD